jgi:adenosylhomocysteine nucleosidase
MKILITFALESEFAPWRATRSFRSSRLGAAAAHHAEVAGAEVLVVLTGVGPRLAALRAAELMRAEADSIQLCISSGLAGAVKADYAIGQILAARAVRSEGLSRDRGSNLLECSAALTSFAEECGATIVNRFYTSERAIGTPEEKERLGQLADAVDMESFAVLTEAAASGIPGIAIRAVSDLADESLPLDMNQVFTQNGHLSVPRVLGQMARHPGAMPGLMKLGKQSKTAAESLARFLDRYVASVAERTAALEARSAGR